MALLQAVQTDNLQYVTANIDSDAWFKNTPWSDYIILNESIKRNSHEVTKFLLDRNCRLNVTDEVNASSTPLHGAVANKNVELVHLLLNKNALLHAKNADGETPVHIAGKVNNAEILDVLMPHIQVEKTTNYMNKYGMSHLHVACMSNNVKVVKKFLKKGVGIKRPVSANSPKYAGFTPLHFAVYNERVTIAEELLNNGADPNAADVRGVTPLHLAFRKKIHPLMELMLIKSDAGIVNLVDDMNISYFHAACSQNDCSILEKFVGHDFDINARIKPEISYLAGYTPLHVAVVCGHNKTVEWLLKHRADFTINNIDGLSPLHVAFWRKEYKIIDLFLDAMKEYDIYDNVVDVSGVSFFHISCLRDNPAVVEEFIKRGAKVNKRIKRSSERLATCTPLHIAVRFENPGNVDVLLKHNALHTVDVNGETPLHYLCQGNEDKLDALMHTIEEMYTGGHGYSMLQDHLSKAVEILGFFIASKVNVNKKDNKGLTPIFNLFNCHYDISIRNRIYEIIPPSNSADRNTVLSMITQYRNTFIKLMALSNPKFNLKDNRGWNLLHHLAARKRPGFTKGLTEIAMLMIRKGANVNAVNDLNETPLFAAICNGHEALVNVLLNHGANVNYFVKSSENNTPLAAAVNYLHRRGAVHKPRILNMLLTFGANVNDVLANGRTVLHMVFAFNKFNEIPQLKLLCDNKCDLNVQERNQGKTPLHFATETGNAYAVKFLLYNGAKHDIKDHQGCDPIGYCVKNPIMTGHAYYNHFHKMRLIGYRYDAIMESNLAKIKAGCKKDCIIPDEIYFQELTRLKDIQINQYNTLYNFLFLSLQEMAKYVSDPNAHKLIICPTFCLEHPFYGTVIATRFRQCIGRYRMLKSSVASFEILTENLLPENVSEKILGYLSNDEVEKVIEASKIKPMELYNYDDEPMDLSTRYR